MRTGQQEQANTVMLKECGKPVGACTKHTEAWLVLGRTGSCDVCFTGQIVSLTASYRLIKCTDISKGNCPLLRLLMLAWGTLA